MSPETEDFFADVASMDLNLSNVKEEEFSEVTYCEVQPKLILVWLHDFMSKVMKEKRSVIEAAEEV